MINDIKKRYDVIVIGAGIGGLTCGCYLAKSGMDVLIVEQHFKPGGCCTSFTRKGFSFDAGGHFIGSFREKGAMRKILNELDIINEIQLLKVESADHVIFPEYDIVIKSNFDDTVLTLQREFPKEADNISIFIEKVKSFRYTHSYLYSNMTFKDILDKHFSDEKLKAFFDILLLYIGVTSKDVSAISAIVLYREFILDGGYYPKGGMQNFSDALANSFKKVGGTFLFSQEVTKILHEKGSVKGVSLVNGDIIECNQVISNADAKKTYSELIDIREINSDISIEFLKKLDEMIPSVSHFNVYLGIDKKAVCDIKERCNIWYVPKYNTRDIMDDMINDPYSKEGFIHIAFPSFYDSDLAPDGCECMFLTVLVPFMSKEFWDREKQIFADILIERAENVIPGLKKHILYKETSTPYTIYRYTLNTKGANYGWSMTPNQTGRMRLPQKSFIKGLYHAGHWTEPGCGIATVAQSGYMAARLVIQNK